MTFTLTNKGVFGLCPVYYANINSEAPLIVVRHWLLVPLMWLSEFVFDLCFMAQDLAGAEPTGWPLKVTGKIEPRQVTFSD